MCEKCSDSGVVIAWSEGWYGTKSEPGFGARKPYQKMCECKRGKK